MKDFCSPFEARKVMPLIQVQVGVRDQYYSDRSPGTSSAISEPGILPGIFAKPTPPNRRLQKDRYPAPPDIRAILINLFPSLTKIQQWQQASSSQALVNVPFVSWAALAHTVPLVRATQTHLTPTSTHVSKPCHSPGASTPLLSTQVKNMHLRWRCRQFDLGKDVHWKLAWMSRIWGSKRYLFLLIKPWGNCFL
jgi:hypothetical protein